MYNWMQKQIAKHRKKMQSGEPGFTLVELVVVIAILGILGGVGTVGYSGYIKSARTKADQQLIAACNEAFAGGCLDAGVELANVTDAKISVSEQRIFGVSSVEGVATETLDKICGTFNILFAGNFDTPFVTEDVKSLDWDSDKSSFVMDFENSVESRIILSNGKSVVIDSETMAQIQASAYADMGYGEVALVIDNLSKSNEGLVSIAKTLGLGNRFSAVLKANGLINNASEADAMSATTISNGLQMVTAKHLSGLSEDELKSMASTTIGTTFLGQDLGTYGVLKNLGSEGGTVTVATMATQYALIEAFAQTDAANSISFSGTRLVKTGDGWFDYNNISYNCSSVEEFLNCDAAKADPVWAMNEVRKQQGYTDYTKTEQYTNDLNGFAATMSLLGDNIGTVNNPGAVDINGYFQNGVYSQDASDVLTSVIGK